MMRFNLRHHISAIIIVICVMPAGNSMLISHESEIQDSLICETIDFLSFNGSLANQSVHEQVDMGPRTPGSNGSHSLRMYLLDHLRGWDLTFQNHQYKELNITNVEAVYNSGMGNIVVLMAHYDTRQLADSVLSNNESPPDGANDGASGVAALLELGRIIPELRLNHEIRLVFTDAEDQGNLDESKNVTSIPWATGSQRWVENLSQTEIDGISSLIVLDMIGDKDLDFGKTIPANNTLWDITQRLAKLMGLVESETDCDGELGEPVFDISDVNYITDDHVPPHNVGIPVMDIIDIRYGSEEVLSGHWHTENDTIDKVSADSLEKVGKLVELGLRLGMWSGSNSTSNDSNSNSSLSSNDPISDTSIENEENTYRLMIGLFVFLFILISSLAGAWVIFAEKQGEV
ncbi:MAG TPA: M28 family peptidase [Candidatus Poseidoniales archaeon]|nr:MAG TPA: M28 family peptidase [Candidatus Poseidoniales archaeon]